MFCSGTFSISRGVLVAALGLAIPVGLVACGVGSDVRPGDGVDGELADRLGLNLSDEAKAQRLEAEWEARLRARPYEEVRGDVHDINGGALAGVVVAIGGKRAVSDQDGRYVIPEVPLGAQVITFQHPDYVLRQDHVFLLPYQGPYASAILLPREEPLIVDAEASFVVKDDRVTLTFPSRSLVYKDSGEPATGEVAVRLTAVDPTLQDVVLAAPAPLQGITERGEPVALRSFQMFEVEMWQGERELQLAEGQRAEMSVDLPAQAETTNGARIPMWYVDEELGVWRQEPEVYAEIAARDGVVRAHAALPHFTSWNIDNYNDTVVTRFKYAASDASSLEYVVLIETAKFDAASASWVGPGTAWAQKSFALVSDSQYERTFQMNAPQCGSDFKFRYKLRAKYINDVNLYDLSLNPPTNQNPSCTFGGNTAARVEFTSSEVCEYINCLGANRNVQGAPLPSNSPEDGNLFGLNWQWIGETATPTVINNQLGVTKFSNGQDGIGVRIIAPTNGYVNRGFQLYAMPFDYTISSAKATSALPGANVDPGFAAYKQASTTPGGAYYYDVDRDGVQDTVDNCATRPNPSQSDVNSNGIGDVCEIACYIPPNMPDRDWYDYDLDTISDECDNKATITNPAQYP